MEEQNNITLWKFVKQHWKLVAFVLLIPILMNYLCTLPFGFETYHEPTKWGELWAGYGGALLSAGIALVILYKQQEQNQKVNEDNRRQNHEENEVNRKQNELQNQINLSLQINALKYQQKYNWYFELKKTLTDFFIFCDLNMVQSIIKDICDYYKVTNKCEIDKTKSKINESIDNYFLKINSRYASFLCLLNKEEIDELHDSLEKIEYDYFCYLNIMNNLSYIIYIVKHPLYNKWSNDEMRRNINRSLELQNKKLEKLDEKGRIVQKLILKEHLEKYHYDFYGNTEDIFNSIFNDFQNDLNSMGNITGKILKYEREKIDKLLDVEEIKKQLNITQNYNENQNKMH